MWISREKYKKLHEENIYSEAKKEICNESNISNQIYFDDFYVIMSKNCYFEYSYISSNYKREIERLKAELELANHRYIDEFQKRCELVEIIRKLEEKQPE